MMRKISQEYLTISIIILLGMLLIFYNLDDTLLWKDEAGTAQIGINTMKYGVPKAWDGQNMIASADGNSFNDEFIVTSHGWLQYYVIGISISIMGQNTFAARFPFAIASLLSILFIWKLAKILFEKKSMANVVALIYVLYIPFVLYSRQARYYSLTFLFLSTSTYLAMSLLFEKGNSKHQSIYLVFSTMLLFFSNHLAALIWVLSIGIYVLLEKRSLWVKIFSPIIIGGLIWTPWYIYSIVTSPNAYGAISFNSHIASKILITIWKTNAYFIPIFSILIILAVLKIIHFIKQNDENKKNRENKSISPLWFFIIISMLNIIIISIPNWSITNHYLLCVVFAAPFLLTYMYYHISLFSPYISIAFLVLILTSNVLNIWPYYCFDTAVISNSDNSRNNLLSLNEKSITNYGLLASPATDWDAYILPLEDYIDSMKVVIYPIEYTNELLAHIDAPNEAIVNILNEHATKGESVMVVGIEFEPIVYYTELRVVNNLSEKIRPWPEQFSDYTNLEKYSSLTYMPDNEVDWIVLKKDGSLNVFDDPNFIDRIATEYEVYLCEVADIPLSNSPDLDYHNFSTAEGDFFYIFHKNK